MPRPGRIVLALCMLAACSGDPEPTDADAVTATVGDADAAEAGEVAVTWLDDGDLAASQSIHRMGGTVSAPRKAEADLRRIARDALVERARTLGFNRLDDLQIEVGCADDAPAANACTAKIVAVASR